MTAQQSLSVFQSLWAMQGLPWPGASAGPPHRNPLPTSWSLGERVERMAGAGFAGVAIDLGAREAPEARDVAPLLREAGLRALVFAFVNETRPLAVALDYASSVGAELVVVCGQVFPAEVSEAADMVRSWMREAAAAGVGFQLETHRYTLTNDLGFTSRLLREMPELGLAVDLSHYVVGNELPDHADPRVDALVTQLLDRGSSFQGRIATRGQVQVSPGFPQHRAAAGRFRGWWEQGFRSWRSRAAPGSDCVFCCELGTVPYAITGPDGVELSDRWREALTLKSWAEELFAAAGRTPVASSAGPTTEGR
jgi:hypothetical protein